MKRTMNAYFDFSPAENLRVKIGRGPGHGDWTIPGIRWHGR